MTKDPYAPPAARVEDADDRSAQTRRPKLVWVIAVLYVVGGGWGLLSTGLMRIGVIPIPPETQAYFQGLSLLDYVLTAVVTILNITGAILLFRLRSKAVAFLAAALAIAILSLLYQLATGALRVLLSTPGSFSMFISIAFSIAIVYYAYRLRANGVLR